MDSNRRSSEPEIVGSAEEFVARLRNSRSATELPRREIKSSCAICAAPGLGQEGDATKSLEVSSTRFNISGMSLQARPKARQRIMQNLVRDRICRYVPLPTNRRKLWTSSLRIITFGKSPVKLIAGARPESLCPQTARPRLQTERPRSVDRITLSVEVVALRSLHPSCHAK